MTSNIIAAFRGADSHRLKGVVVGACKAPRVGVKDTLGRTTTATNVIGEAQLSPSTPRRVSKQGPSAVRTSSSSLGGRLAHIEEELNLVSANMLSPCYKGLVFAFIHLALPQFHESVE